MRDKLLRYDADKFVPFLMSREMVAEMVEWSPPVQVKVKVTADVQGLGDLQVRYIECIDAR